MPRVMIHPASYQDCLTAVRRAFELFPISISGKKVLVKPNVLRSGSPDEGITTNPAVLRAVVQCLETMNPAEIIVGDNPGLMNYGANEATFRQTGLWEASLGHYRNIGLESVEMDFDPGLAPKVSVSKAVMDADLIISVPKFKTHGLTIVTGAVKNSYGILPGAQKANLHRLAGNPARFQEVVVDVFKLRVPDLFIMDAVIGMEGNGPASTELRYIGKILAADNAVAMDAIVARMMGLEPGRLRFLEKAKSLGLGDYEASGIEVIGDLTPIPEFRVPPLGGEAIAGSTVIRDLIRARSLLRPQANPDLCTGCGTCVEQCPVSALSLEDGLPQVAADRCIICFCCQEMCPEKAIKLH